MDIDLEQEPDLAAELGRAAYGRLLRTLAQIDDAVVATPSRLPGWTVGHVLTHLARNADAHARRTDAALAGREVAKYAGGADQRAREIDEGAARSARAMIDDLTASQERLDGLFRASTAAGWPHGDLRGGAGYAVRGCPAHRLREIEMHHVDLGLGYGPESWSEEYVAWDLPVLLATVPDRLDLADRRSLAAWLAGRGPLPPDLDLAPWG